MSRIKFIDESHKYLYEDTQYQSVSSIWKFVNRFHAGYHSKRMAFREVMGKKLYKKFKNQVGERQRPEKKMAILESVIAEYCNEHQEEMIQHEQEIYLHEWDEKREKSVELGTMYHNYREEDSLDRGVEYNPKVDREFEVIDFDKEYDNEAMTEDLKDLPDGYHPERIVFNHKHQIAGTPDRLFIETIDGKRYVDISDYKTDEIMEVRPRKYYKMRTMPFPVDHLMNTNYFKYELKTSTYMWMLEQHGFTPRHMWLVHVNKDEDKPPQEWEEKEYDITYRREEVKMVLSFRKRGKYVL